MVLYRKYRPQSLEDLIGQTQVKQALLLSFANHKLSHAYLFVGPRGTGKTSTARILAKMVNCEKPSPTPCNKCDTCISITDGSNLDLIEIDAASNRGIDDVRALRENIKLSPSSARKKVYIIDEVHMLTTEAFNALLKTLEEPPEHAFFILATTDATKVPATILSRVTRLDFKPAKLTDLVAALEVVAKGEGIKVESGALEIIAGAADGSFRDGVKLLDQISTLGKITIKEVGDNLNVTPFNSLVELVGKLAKKDTRASLLEVNKQIEGGVGVKELMLQLMEILRAEVLIKNGLENLAKEDFDSGRYEKLVSLTEQFSMGDLVKSLDALQIALEKLKFVSIPSLPLELAVVEICNGSGSSGIKAPHLEDARGPSVSRRASSVVSLPAATRWDPSSPSPLASNSVQTSVSSTTSSGDIKILQDKWTFILETVRQDNFSLEALLRGVKIQSVQNGLVILEVPYSFHQRILEAQKSKDLLESVLSSVLGKPAKVSTILGTRQHSIEEISNIELAADDEIITLASDIFNGKLVD